jgi:uridine kinase
MNRSELLYHLAETLVAQRRDYPLRVAVDGIDAAGKTTLADQLAEILEADGYPVIRASIDGFHNPKEIRSRQGNLSPDGYYEDSFDFAAIKTLLLDPLSSDGSGRYHVGTFDYRTDAEFEADEQVAQADAILIFDGIFLQRPEIVESWDIKIFIDIPFGIALTRALERDLMLFGSEDAVRERYMQRYLPGQQLYFDQCNPKGNADIVIDNQDVDNPEIVMNRL